VKGTRGGSWDAGIIRRSPVYLAGNRRGMEHSRFVPVPAGEQLVQGMNDWENWINEPNDVPLLVKAALGTTSSRRCTHLRTATDAWAGW